MVIVFSFSEERAASLLAELGETPYFSNTCRRCAPDYISNTQLPAACLRLPQLPAAFPRLPYPLAQIDPSANRARGFC